VFAAASKSSCGAEQFIRAESSSRAAITFAKAKARRFPRRTIHAPVTDIKTTAPTAFVDSQLNIESARALKNGHR
jgi:hypothetical protein